MTASVRENILHLRMLVGFLGERAQYTWWPTAFYGASSRLFLEPVLVKTSRLAQYHGVVEAARRLHDEHLSVGSYHLFRLPEEIEQDLHSLAQSQLGETLAATDLRGKDVALAALREFSSNAHAESVGPISVGSIRDLEAAATLKAIASVYWSAFTKNIQSYPYLVA